MINNLKVFKNALKEINVLTKEKEVNKLILKEFETIIQDLNCELNISNNNIDNLEKQEKKLKELEQSKHKYKIKGYIYTFFPLLVGLIFSPIIFNTLPLMQAIITLCLTVAILSPIASIMGFEEYEYIKKELKKLPKIINDLHCEYKNNKNLKYDLIIYIYQKTQIKEEQQSILKNIQEILDTTLKTKDVKDELFVSNNNVYDELILNKNNIKVKK